MSRSLTVSEELYARLETAARERGLPGIEQLLEMWQANERQQIGRNDAVRRIDELRGKLQATYGEMPDSTVEIRSDRAR